MLGVTQSRSTAHSHGECLATSQRRATAAVSSVQREQGRRNLRVLCPPTGLTANVTFWKSSDGTLGVRVKFPPELSGTRNVFLSVSSLSLCLPLPLFSGLARLCSSDPLISLKGLEALKRPFPLSGAALFLTSGSGFQHGGRLVVGWGWGGGAVLTQFSHHTEPLLAAENGFNLLPFSTQTTGTTLIPFAPLIKCPFTHVCVIYCRPLGSVVVTSFYLFSNLSSDPKQHTCRLVGFAVFSALLQSIQKGSSSRASVWSFSSL